MLVNSSSSNNSLPHQHLPSNDLLFNMGCPLSRWRFLMYTTYNSFILLLLPLCIFILHHGLQQWRKKRSTSSASTISHCDCFTYHLVAMELVGVIGCVLCVCGVYREDPTIIKVGSYVMVFTFYGEMFFHLLTCGERYLAVVHPITYLSLRRERGVRLRNISVACVWLICFVGTGLMCLREMLFLNVCLLILAFTVVSFCSLSVLRVLIGPGPGEQGGGWERVDQSKKRAFYTIVVILGVLVLRFTGNIVAASLYFLTHGNGCVSTIYGSWLNVPSSLVLPLLFLHREGKLLCCKTNLQGGMDLQN